MADDYIAQLTLDLQKLAATNPEYAVCNQACEVILLLDEALSKAERDRSTLLEALLYLRKGSSNLNLNRVVDAALQTVGYHD